MQPALTLNVPGKQGATSQSITFEPGRSVVIVGANGAGKTRLAVWLEAHLPQEKVQRISAHRSLGMPDSFEQIKSESAERRLRFGTELPRHQKNSVRWGSKPATHLLDDYTFLLQSLFADLNQVSIKFRNDCKLNPSTPFVETKLDRLQAIWNRLLPHRKLHFDDAVKVSIEDPTDTYSGSEMSDGERAMFYMIGQCLSAPSNGFLIIDEPENHIHKAIVGPLWNAIELARPDCSFIYITHDLKFTVERGSSCQKFYLRAYEPETWEMERIPEATGLPNQLVAELIGSRKPILFVEGEPGSLDLLAYNAVYSDWTIVPIGSCQAVIHAVSTFNSIPGLHWITARGVVDGDHRDGDAITSLQAKGIYVLPVAEVENVFLLPLVFKELAAAFRCPDPRKTMEDLKQKILTEATINKIRVGCDYTIRALDQRLKRVEISGRDDIAILRANFTTELSAVDPNVIYNEFVTHLEQSIATSDVESVLNLYDCKGLLRQSAAILGLIPSEFEPKLRFLLASQTEGAHLRAALTAALPVIPVPVQSSSVLPAAVT